jgi:hypothetical protein
VLATRDYTATRTPLSARATVRVESTAPTVAANLCPGCGPVADELSSRFCDRHGMALRAAVASWRAARAAV